MEKISFSTNVPVELGLAFLEGKLVPSNFGGNQYLFSTTDGRSFYVSEAVGNILHDQIKKHGIQRGEPVEICKREVDGGRGRKSIQWGLSRLGILPGEQPDGTFAVDRAGAGASTPAPANGSPNGKPLNNGNGTANGNGNGNGHRFPSPEPPAITRTDALLLQCLTSAITAAHQAEKFAAECNYSVRFTSEDIRTIANMLFIQAAREGVPHVA